MDELTGEIISAAITVHRILGPGLLESAYQRCLEIEFRKRGLLYEREKPLGLVYSGEFIPEVYRLDFIIEGLVIIEVKSVQRWDPIFDAQLLTYLKLTGVKVGLLLNFNVPALRNGIKRIVLNYEDKLTPSASRR